jgi:hypothetical protein
MQLKDFERLLASCTDAPELAAKALLLHEDLVGVDGSFGSRAGRLDAAPERLESRRRDSSNASKR